MAAHQHPAWKASPGSVADELFSLRMLKAASEGDSWAPEHLCSAHRTALLLPCMQLPCHSAGLLKKKKLETKKS